MNDNLAENQLPNQEPTTAEKLLIQLTQIIDLQIDESNITYKEHDQLTELIKPLEEAVHFKCPNVECEAISFIYRSIKNQPIFCPFCGNTPSQDLRFSAEWNNGWRFGYNEAIGDLEAATRTMKERADSIYKA